MITTLLASTALGAPLEKVTRHQALFGNLNSLLANTSTGPSFRYFDFDELNMAASRLKVKKGGVDPPCEDLPPQFIGAVTGGAIPNCEILIGALASAGITCNTDLGTVLPDATNHTAKEYCCATCAAGAGEDPVTSSCNIVKHNCIEDIQMVSNENGTGKCDDSSVGCDKLDPTNPNPIDYAACIACVEQVFGADYRPCSCCLIPILAAANIELSHDKQAVIDVLFPCD